MNAKRYSKQSKKTKGDAPTKLKTGYPSKFKKTKNKKPPTHSSTLVSYDTFLEQMAQRKMQTKSVICSNIVS